MARVQLKESAIPTNFKINLREHYHMTFEEQRVEAYGKAIMTTIAEFLRSNESKDAGKVGFKIVDFKGNMVVGGIVTYIEPAPTNEDEEVKGNWTLDLTFDYNDFDFPTVYDNMNGEFEQIMERQMSEFVHARFFERHTIHKFAIDFFETIKTFLDTNCLEDDVFEVELPGFFIASVGIEDGEKVMSIVPGEVMKQHIKDDAAI